MREGELTPVLLLVLSAFTSKIGAMRERVANAAEVVVIFMVVEVRGVSSECVYGFQKEKEGADWNLNDV